MFDSKKKTELTKLLLPCSQRTGPVSKLLRLTIANAVINLPIFFYSSQVLAQSVPESTTARFKYVYYNDFQSGSDERISVKTPMLLVNAPLSDSLEMEAGVVLDSVSGASPLYLDTLSGASGKGISDERKAADLKFTKYFENFSIGVGGALSKEHDYESRSGSLETRIWNEDKTTTLALGVSADFDSITSSNDFTLKEDRNTLHWLLGATQIINPVSMLQTNITYASGDGYYSDPYKIFDNRPRSREEWAWLTRYVVYLSDLNASFHADYRLFVNSWGITSNTFEMQLYKPIGSTFTLRPGLRYYTQSSAEFFSTTVPPQTTDSFNSADQRLANFGGVSAGLKGILNLSNQLSLDFLYEYMLQDQTLGFSSGDNGTNSFGSNYFQVGISKKF